MDLFLPAATQSAGILNRFSHPAPHFIRAACVIVVSCLGRLFCVSWATGFRQRSSFYIQSIQEAQKWKKSRRSFLSRIDFTPGLPTRLQAPSTTTRRNHLLQSLSIPFDCESSLWRAENINHRPCKSPATADRSARFVNNDLFLFSCAVSFCSTRRLFKSQRISLTRRKMLLQSRFLHCANQRWFHSARPPFTVRPRTTRFSVGANLFNRSFR